MTTPDKKLLSHKDMPTITLDGVRWPVPKLATKQNRIVVPLILTTMPKIRDVLTSSIASDPSIIRPSLEALAKMLTTEGIDDLATVVYWSLERGHPGLTVDEFQDMTIGTLELVEAVLVIARQTGVLKSGNPSAGPLGRRPTVRKTAPSTGTQSSPASA